jgi:hypothetical protein
MGARMTDGLGVIGDNLPAFFLTVPLLWFASERIIPGLLRSLGSRESIAPPRGADRYVWREIVATQAVEGGKWLGRFERVIFFLSILTDTPALAAGWLAFKVASKWEAWANVHKVPEAIEGVDPLDFLRARTALGSSTYQRFLVGTMADLLIAFVFVGVFYLLSKYLPLIWALFCSHMGCPRFV